MNRLVGIFLLSPIHPQEPAISIAVHSRFIILTHIRLCPVSLPDKAILKGRLPN